MFCRECGKSMPDRAKFCPKCGTKVITIQPKEVEDDSVQEESISGKKDGELISDQQRCPDLESASEKTQDVSVIQKSEEKRDASVTQRSEGPKPLQNALLKTITISDNKYLALYEDRLEYHGGTVYYKDIASVAAGGGTAKSRGSLISHSTFRGELKILLYDGSKHSIKVGGGTVIGIGNTKESEAVFQEILNATYQIIAKKVAECLFDQIMRGMEPQLGLVRVSKDRMYIRKLIGKSERVVPKEDFGICRVDRAVYILSRYGETLAKIDASYGNSYVLPHLLNALYSH